MKKEGEEERSDENKILLCRCCLRLWKNRFYTSECILYIFLPSTISFVPLLNTPFREEMEHSQNKTSLQQASLAYSFFQGSFLENSILSYSLKARETEREEKLRESLGERIFNEKNCTISLKEFHCEVYTLD